MSASTTVRARRGDRLVAAAPVLVAVLTSAALAVLPQAVAFRKR